MKFLSLLIIYPFLLINDLHISVSTKKPLEELRKQSKKTLKIYLEKRG